MLIVPQPLRVELEIRCRFAPRAGKPEHQGLLRIGEWVVVNGMEAPGTTRGTAADAGRAGHEPPDEKLVAATHRQLTTGDVAAFRAVAERMFGETFPEIEAVDLGVGAP